MRLAKASTVTRTPKSFCTNEHATEQLAQLAQFRPVCTSMSRVIKDRYSCCLLMLLVSARRSCLNSNFKVKTADWKVVKFESSAWLLCGMGDKPTGASSAQKMSKSLAAM